MDFVLLWFLCIVFIVMYLKLSARVRRCEELLTETKKPVELHKSEEEPKIIRKTPVKEKPFEVPNIIKENWMGVFGSIALVIGAAFFGLTSSIMQRPDARVVMMIAGSLILFAISQKIKYQSQWVILSGWLKSIAGAIILFATLGAGSIAGLQFITNPIYALSFLSLGIAANIFLVLTSPSEVVASLHVLLCIIAFCIPPQILILLPMGALVACLGLIAAYRSRWDLHYLVIIVAFAFQNAFWTYSLDNILLPWMHYLAIACSVAVGIAAASIHYSKEYKSPKLVIEPLIAHILNWALLTWNIWIHAQFLNWVPYILLCVAIAGFILARVAKKKKIFWLYYTDTLISQMVIMVAIASFNVSPDKYLDLSLIILFETMIFNIICLLQKEDIILRVGYSFQYIAYFIVMYFITSELDLHPYIRYPIYLRMGVVAALSWAFHELSRAATDDFRFILYGTKDSKNSVSIMALFGTIFFIGIYSSGNDLMTIQSIVLGVMCALGLLKQYFQDFTWKLIFNISMIAVHAINGCLLIELSMASHLPSIFSRVDFLGLVVLDLIMVPGNRIVVYLLGIQSALLALAFTEKTILTLLWVGLACIYFAFGLLIKSKRIVQLAMAALGFCSLRLIIFDLVQSDPYIRVLVFIGVGVLMLSMSVIYKKYRNRIEL